MSFIMDSLKRQLICGDCTCGNNINNCNQTTGEVNQSCVYNGTTCENYCESDVETSSNVTLGTDFKVETTNENGKT